MKNKMLKMLFIVANTIIFTILLSNVVKAANLTISTSKASVAPGESFTVTVSLNGGAGPVSASTSNATGSKSEWLDNGSYSFTCKAGNSGAVTINASGTVGDYATEKDVTVNASKTVNIIQNNTSTTTNKTVSNKKTNTNKTTTSKTSTKKATTSKTTTVIKKEPVKDKEETRYLLKKLKIVDLNITPEFNSEIYEYEVKVIGNSIDKLKIEAESNKSDTILNIKGNENLQVGKNTIIIELKGQDDKQTTIYKINVIKEKSDLDIANEQIEKLVKGNKLLFVVLIGCILINIVLIVILVVNKVKSKKKEVEK